jgi:hypothetical protein
LDRWVTVRFYRVDRKNAVGPLFSDCIRQAYGRGDGHRECDIGDEILLRIDNVVEAGGYLSGQYLRRQLRNLPPRLADHGPPEELGLPAGYGLGHGTAFRYHLGLSVLALQENRQAVGVSRISGYLETILQTQGFDFRPAINRDAWAQLNRTNPRKFRFRVAEPDHLEAVEEPHQTVRRNLSQMKRVAGGAFVEFEVGMGHTDGNLDARATRSVARWINGEYVAGRGGVKALVIEGADREDETQKVVLDLIKAQLSEREILDLPDDNPVENYAIRSKHLARVFQRQMDALRDQFGAQQG